MGTPNTGYLLVNCTALDAEREAPLADAGIWVQGEKIAAVGPVDDVRRAARAAQMIDLDAATVLPGLFNMHTHFGELTYSPKGVAEYAFVMAKNARAALHAGVTTVRLVGEAYGVDFGLRTAIEVGHVPGPRVFSAGCPIMCTGGHGHASPAAITADGPAEFRKAVRSQVSAGADLIKVMLSGGIAGKHERIDTRQLADDELLAVIEVAHTWDRKVTAHAGPGPVISNAVESGLDGVEHGFQLDELAVRAMAERKTTLVPTLIVTRCKEFYERVGAPAWLIERALSAGESHQRGIAAAAAAGVPLAVGTDMRPGDAFEETNANTREIEYLVELAGVTPLEAIRAATTTPAAWLGIADEVGTIEGGRRADLVACDGDPTKDISTLRSLRFVMKAGKIVRHDRAMPAFA